VRWLAAIALAAGCVADNYECHSDTDCDTGSGGRCELDHRCTVLDTSCATGRRYTDHSGPVAATCFDDRAALANPCVGGQPPAIADGCAATVCEQLPACCTSGWTDACVQEAQVSCPGLGCSTEIAITATKGGAVELWTLAWNGSTWTITPRTDRDTWIGFLGPAPGTTEPRLAGFTSQSSFMVGDARFDTAPGRVYLGITSVDFDRDGRDTIALAWEDNGTPPKGYLELEKLDTAATRDLDLSMDMSIVDVTWGTYDDDAYPDPAAGQFNKGGTNLAYYVLDNSLDDATGQRTLSRPATINFGAGGSPSLRSFEFADFNRDHQLDVVAIGNSARIHLFDPMNNGISDKATNNFDCSPIERLQNQCAGMPTSDMVSVAGATTRDPADGNRPALLLSTDVTRELYLVTHVDTTPSISKLIACPVAPCAPILAVVARDLDHDGKLDIIAIDADLHILTRLSTSQSVANQAIPTTNTAFTSIRTSAAGSPP
jgi:hypothetical protein